MTCPAPGFKVKVDVTNPGQFFACCGLLELAHRVWRNGPVEGWFANGGFCVAGESASNSFSKLLEALANTPIRPLDVPHDRALLPVRLEGLDFTMDWWVDERGKKTTLKLWAGNQTSLKIVEDMRNALKTLRLANPEELFLTSVKVSGRFGVDPRAAWNALDVGFSPNAHGMKWVTYPAVELLAAIGLQRFRPVTVSGRNRNSRLIYSTWISPLGAAVSSAAAAGILPGAIASTYQFRILDRGSYGGFDYAITQEVNHE